MCTKKRKTDPKIKRKRWHAQHGAEPLRDRGRCFFFASAGSVNRSRGTLPLATARIAAYCEALGRSCIEVGLIDYEAVHGANPRTLEGILYDRVLYERNEAPPGSSELATFNAVEGRRLLTDGRSRICAPPTAAELLRLCCDVHKAASGLPQKETEKGRLKGRKA